MSFMRRELPIFLVAIMVVIQVVEYVVKLPVLNNVGAELRVWGTILAAFSMGVGLYGVLGSHIRNIQRRVPKMWYWSAWWIIVYVVMVGIGFTLGTEYWFYQWLYDNVLVTLFMTMVSTTGFFILYAAFRAFRARTLEAALMLTSGVLVMMRNIPAIRIYAKPLYTIGEWIYNVPTAGALRGITIGAALGMTILALRVMLGYERAFLAMPSEEGGTGGVGGTAGVGDDD